MPSISAAITLLAAATVPADPLSPAEVFALVGSAITNGTKTHGCLIRNNSDHRCSFGQWSYGDAIINAELIDARATLGLDFHTFTDAKLDYWTSTPGAVGFNLTRNISMVFQNYALYPHMSVYGPPQKPKITAHAQHRHSTSTAQAQHRHSTGTAQAQHRYRT